jgi:hypothetical protein
VTGFEVENRERSERFAWFKSTSRYVSNLYRPARRFIAEQLARFDVAAGFEPDDEGA